MFISTIIPTIGRSTLARAAYSVLDQGLQHEACEVIVVNDSGQDLPVEDWQKLPNVRIVATNRLNRSIARNTGAAIAKGRYLHFLDDDDWMLPGAFEAFWESTKESPVGWIHGAFRMVDNSGNTVVDIFPEEVGNCFLNLVSWEWLPLQASIVDTKAFFKVGGFAMLESLMGGFEDIHLARQVAYYTDFLNIPRLVACIRSGDSESTTNYEDMFIQNRRSRELNLDMPGSYQRLISSARNNGSRKGYWHGKVVYYFLVSAAQNLRDNRFLVTASRAFYALASLLTASKFLMQADFWRGATKPHYSRVGLAIKNSGKGLYQNTRWKMEK